MSIADYATVKESYQGTAANLYPLHKQTSLFGVHTADPYVENDLTWDTNDYANFQVSIVKDDKFSSNAYFKLSSTTGGLIPEMTSSIFDDVYDDQLWTVSVTVAPTKIESINQVSGSEESGYTVRFYGVNHIADYKAQEFLVTGTISNDSGRKILSSPKRVFVGAHRNNFTGSIVDFADTKIESCRAWYASLPTGTIDNHNIKLGNFGAERPTQNAFLYQNSINDKYVPQAHTLALLWDFTSVTGSDSNGEFAVEDVSSGSLSDNRYGWFSGLVSRRHTASGSFFLASSKEAVESLERSTFQPQVPEVLMDSNLTRILSEDDEFFNRNTRPTTYHLSIEKNLFQDISEEMLNMFGSVVWFNNMIGTPVNAYRGEYKELKKAADLFFEKVANDYDFDKYVEYFKFIDYAVSRYLVKLIPMSMLTFEDGISTVIENFVLGDRSKFTNKYSLVKDVKSEPDGIILGVNELSYPWKEGHAPITNDEADNCTWFKERSERANPIISSGDSNVDINRQTQLDSIVNETNATAPTLYNVKTSETYQGSTYVTRRLARPYKVKGINQPDIHGGGNAYQNKKVGFWDSIRKRPTQSTPGEGGLISIEPPDSKLESFKDCDDNLELNRGKRKYKFSVASVIDGGDDFSNVFKGDLVFPFGLYSSSIKNEAAMAPIADFQINLAITNLHHDSYGPFGDVPMQGPFTEKYVGGRAYRHVMTNFTPDNDPPDSEGERLEGWRITGSAEGIDLLNIAPENPKSVYFREEYAKRPVNIKNIKQLTAPVETEDQATDANGVTKIGNYSETYEIVMTNGRSLNNRYLVESEGNLPTEISSRDSAFVSGVIDFPLVRRDLTGSNKAIIVNRFSAPGDVSTMTEGMLDIAAAQFSVYNAMPFRNLPVRTVLNELYSDHSNQFGFFSDQFTVAAYDEAGFAPYPGGFSTVNFEDYSGTGSFHKVNRNGRPAITFGESLGRRRDDPFEQTVKYDNFHVQHAIPQTDVQYAWITASLIQNYTGSALFDYEKKDTSRGDFASSDLVFVSSSDVGGQIVPNQTNIRFPTTKEAATTTFYEIDFVGLNTIVRDEFDPDNNIVGQQLLLSLGLTPDPFGIFYGGYNNDIVGSLINTVFNPALTPYLNSILLNRQGPYGGANWKLYRKDNHPIVRHQKNHNQIGYLERVIGVKDPERPPSLVKNFTEPPVTSKYKPLIYKFKTGEERSITVALSSLGNIEKHFTDHTKESKLSRQYSGRHLDNIIPIRPELLFNKSYSPYAAFLNYLNENNIKDIAEVSYAETIYPKGLYTYLSGTRKRLNFVNKFWRDTREHRTENLLPNSREQGILTSSIWKLDSHDDFAENAEFVPYKGGMTQQDGVGELQNCYSLFHYQTGSDVVATINYNRRIKLIYQDKDEFPSSAPAELRAREADLYYFPTFATLQSASAIARYSASVGDTFWEATSSNDHKPFYDNYDQYAEEGFRNLKDGTVLPEFIISDYMSRFIANANNLQYDSYSPAGFFDVSMNMSKDLQIQFGLLSLTGTDNFATTEEFLNRYVFSDFYDYFKLVEEDFEDQRGVADVPTDTKLRTTKHKLTCEAILKFLPYDGFYPSERTTQLGKIFFQSLTADLFGTEKNVRTAAQPFFAPGILFNSIKSGIAVDYPVFTNEGGFTATPSLCWGHAISGNFDTRIPFGDLVQPKNIRIYDAEVDPDLALDSTASIVNVKDDHTFAMSNFLAETMNLFIGRGANQQAMIRSNQDNEVDAEIIIPEDGTYTMYLNLMNSMNIKNVADYLEQDAIMRVSPYDYVVGNADITSSLQVNTASVTMYDRAITGFNIDPFLYGSSFGPPVETGEFGKQDRTSAFKMGPINSDFGITGSAFDPFTPAYYNGFGTVQIFANLKEGVTTREEIFATASYSYNRLPTFSYPTVGNYATALLNAYKTTNHRYKMQLSASLFLGDENPNHVLYETKQEFQTEDGATAKKQLVAFKPRWECPVLDFTNASPQTSFISGNVAKGMWHQYGEIPERDNGIKLQAEGPNGKFITNNNVAADYPGLKDLARLLNIDTTQFSKVGKLNSSGDLSISNIAAPTTQREFSEAIIAIPFKYNEIINQTEFYHIDKEQFNLVKSNLYKSIDDRFDPLTTLNIRTFNEIKEKSPSVLDESKELYDLMSLMRKYVIPPHLDFLHNDKVSPFVMFMIEYSINLTQKDLQNMWQNVEPTFARKALKVKSETSLHLMPTTKAQGRQPATDVKIPYHPYFAPKKGLNEFFDSTKTRWAVFKVKKRAAMNYNSMVGKINLNGTEYIRKDLGPQQANDFLYSYNWPYDFFSLIELAKLNSITTFNPTYNEEE